jgi:hypothetical protein
MIQTAQVEPSRETINLLLDICAELNDRLADAERNAKRALICIGPSLAGK